MPEQTIDVTDLLTPDAQTTAKRLRGKYKRLAEADRRVRCDACTAEPATPGTVVAAFPRPWADGERLLCMECWAAESAARTSLGEAEAHLLAAKYAGLSVPEMASATGRSESDIEPALRELHKRASAIETKRSEIEQTAAVLEGLDHRN